MTIRIPPPLLMLAAGGTGWALARALPQLTLPWSWLTSVGTVVALLGIVCLVWCAAAFLTARTTIDPLHPDRASTLVTHGLYRLSRNPMYLGMALLLAGLALRLANPAALTGLALFVWAVTVMQIRPEERALTTRFGDAYRTYCQTTRRWI